MAWSVHITILYNNMTLTFQGEQGSVSSVSQMLHSESTTGLIYRNTTAETTNQDLLSTSPCSIFLNSNNLNQQQIISIYHSWLPVLYNHQNIYKIIKTFNIFYFILQLSTTIIKTNSASTKKGLGLPRKTCWESTSQQSSFIQQTSIYNQT